jgi:hypothetical protein
MKPLMWGGYQVPGIGTISNLSPNDIQLTTESNCDSHNQRLKRIIRSRGESTDIFSGKTLAKEYDEAA